MRASWVREGTFLRLTLLPDAEDPITSPRPPHLRMLTNVATLKLPHEIELPHPDLLALAAYSIAFPWTQRRLRLSTPVSDRMREAFARSGIDASGPVGSQVDPREAGNRLSLAYSGGADSIATSEVLPDDTAYVHLRRVKHPRVVNRMTHVRVDVIEALVRKAQTRGRDVSVVQTDLEYLCLPFATYPVWWAISIGSIVLADETDAGGVATGTVLEGRYLANGTRWTGRGALSSTHRLYDAAGIPIVRPAAGMTEVPTARLCLASDLADLARSCLLGSAERPCLRCEKCVRKELITAAITGGALPRLLIQNMRTVPAMTAKMRVPPPLFVQDMLEYALARVDVAGTPLESVKEVLAPTPESTSWAERYYTPALEDEVPERFREEIAREIFKRLEPMGPEDLEVVETWDAAARVPSS